MKAHFAYGMASKGGQKHISKTQGFSVIFLAGRNSCHHLGPPAAPKNPKTSIFPSKTLGFGAKVKKTQRFFHTFGSHAISRTCLNIRKGSGGKSFFFMFLRPFGLIPKCSEFNPNGTGSGRKLVTTGPPQVHTHSFNR